MNDRRNVPLKPAEVNIMLKMINGIITIAKKGIIISNRTVNILIKRRDRLIKAS